MSNSRYLDLEKALLVLEGFSRPTRSHKLAFFVIVAFLLLTFHRFLPLDSLRSEVSLVLLLLE
jgi:hypothetical protein